MKKSNTENAINRLRKLGWVVTKVGDKWNVHRIGSKEYCYPPDHIGPPIDMLKTDRELIKFAKCYSSENNQNTALKKNLKDHNGKERTYTRNILNSKKDDIDDFLNLDKNEKREDIWTWD